MRLNRRPNFFYGYTEEEDGPDTSGRRPVGDPRTPPNPGGPNTVDPDIFEPDGSNPGPYKRPDFTPTWWDPDGDGNPGGGGGIPNLTPGIPGFDEPPIEIPNIFDPSNPLVLPPLFVPGLPGIFPEPRIFRNPIKIPFPKGGEPIYLPKGIDKRDPDGDGRPGRAGRDYEPDWWNDPEQFPRPDGWPEGADWPPAWPDPEGDPPSWWPPAWGWPPNPDDFREAQVAQVQ